MRNSSPRWAVGHYDSDLPPDLRTDEEIEQDAADRCEEAAYRARHADRIAKEGAEAKAHYEAHVAWIKAQRKEKA